MIQQNSNFLLSIRLSSFPSFCLANPEIFSTLLFVSHEKKTESFSFKLQTFISSLIAFSEKNFAIGPLPIIFL